MRRYKRTITTPSSKLIANGSLWYHAGFFYATENALFLLKDNFHFMGYTQKVHDSHLLKTKFIRVILIHDSSKI